MKRIIATILAGSLSALTLAAAPAHADEGRAYDQQGSQQRYDQGDEYQQNRDRRGGDVNAYRHDSDGYRRDGGYADGRNGRGRSHGYPQPDPRREQRNRQASVGVGTGDFQVYVNVGGWLAQS